jgi:[ribosomal protein S5]-alanine N-acetyltransferase
MELETPRLIIRDLEKNDAKAFAETGNDKEINYFNWYLPYPLTLEKTKKIIEKRTVKFMGHRWLYELGIILKETKEFMGIVSLYDVSKPENKGKLGYWIGKNYRRKGYAEEAVKKMIKFAFQNLKLNKISAKTMTDNKKSELLLKKLKFRKIRIKKWDKVIEGKRYDVAEWELLNKYL